VTDHDLLRPVVAELRRVAEKWPATSPFGALARAIPETATAGQLRALVPMLRAAFEAERRRS
jgi:hypothetical protein